MFQLGGETVAFCSLRHVPQNYVHGCANSFIILALQ